MEVVFSTGFSVNPHEQSSWSRVQVELTLFWGLSLFPTLHCCTDKRLLWSRFGFSSVFSMTCLTMMGCHCLPVLTTFGHSNDDTDPFLAYNPWNCTGKSNRESDFKCPSKDLDQNLTYTKLKVSGSKLHNKSVIHDSLSWKAFTVKSSQSVWTNGILMLIKVSSLSLSLFCLCFAFVEFFLLAWPF